MTLRPFLQVMSLEYFFRGPRGQRVSGEIPSLNAISVLTTILNAQRGCMIDAEHLSARNFISEAPAQA